MPSHAAKGNVLGVECSSQPGFSFGCLKPQVILQILLYFFRCTNELGMPVLSIALFCISSKRKIGSRTFWRCLELGFCLRILFKERTHLYRAKM